jgi:two-component system response regulator AtoC
LESELFGHEKGSFTGAIQRQIGKLEYAAGGTVFLDEIAEFPLELQAKLLRVLQEREFQRVGGVKTIPLHARIIAASNRNLEDTAKRGLFREDLYFRLQVFVIRIPALRERPEDIMPLAEYFLNRLNQELHKKVVRIPTAYSEIMQAYDWPGNVRELQNVLRRSVILSPGDTLELEENWLRRKSRLGEKKQTPDKEEDVLRNLAEMEKVHIHKVLQYTGGNYGQACEILGISRPTLRKKIRDYELKEFAGFADQPGEF